MFKYLCPYAYQDEQMKHSEIRKANYLILLTVLLLTMFFGIFIIHSYSPLLYQQQYNFNFIPFILILSSFFVALFFFINLSIQFTIVILPFTLFTLPIFSCQVRSESLNFKSISINVQNIGCRKLCVFRC